MKSKIAGQAYQTKSDAFACNQMINLYLEVAPSDSKSPTVLLRAQGTSEYSANPAGSHDTGYEVRGMWKASNGTGFAIIRDKLYSLFLGALTELGTLNTSSGLVDIRDNGTQMIIVDGTAGYLVTLSTNAFAVIADVDFPNGAATVAYCDTYFVAGVPGTQQYKISGQGDGSAWDALDFASAEADPDVIVSTIETHREIKLFGFKTTETVVDSGDATFPFTRPGSAVIDHGCVAPRSPAKINNTVCWLHQDDLGAGIVYMITGLSSSQRISTHAIEYAISQWARMDDAFAFAMQDGGHAFYWLTSPSAGETWVYDFATSLWHQRAYFLGGEFTRHRANCHMFHEGKHLVGDFENGKIYELSSNIYADNGAEQKWLRSWREQANERKRAVFHKLEIDAEMGVGLDGGVQGEDALVMLEYSDDGGKTWNGPIESTFGAIGEYSNRCEFWDLGDAVDRVWRLSGTDPVMTAINGAYVDMTPCYG